MILTEIKTQKGTYAGVKFDEKTTKAITKYLNDNKIPNGLQPSKLHTTVLYSRKHCPNYKAQGKYSTPIIGTPGEFELWDTSPTEGPSTKCLVLKYNCPDLIKRHEHLMDEHKASFDYDKYQPHITLSYDCGDLEIDELPDIKQTLPKIVITDEYKEDLNLDWAKSNS